MTSRLTRKVMITLAMLFAGSTAHALSFTIGDLENFVNNAKPCPEWSTDSPDLSNLYTDNISLGDLTQANTGLDAIGCHAEYLLATTIKEGLANSDLLLQGGEALYSAPGSDSIATCDVEVKGEVIDLCPGQRFRITNVYVDANISADSSIDLNVNSPTHVSANLAFNIDATATGNIAFETLTLQPSCLSEGMRCPVSLVCDSKGNCAPCPVPEVPVCLVPGPLVEVWEETGNVDFIGTVNNAKATADMNVRLNATWADPVNNTDTLSISPSVNMDGNLDPYDPSRTWGVTFTGVNGIVIPEADRLHLLRMKYLVTDIDPVLGAVIADKAERKLDSRLSDIERRLATAIRDRVGSITFPSDGIPKLVVGMLNRLPLVLPAVMNYMPISAKELFKSLLLGDRATVENLLQPAAVCAAADWAEVANMPHMPMYQPDASGVCTAVDPLVAGAGVLFEDPACTRATYFLETPRLEYCHESLSKTALGNPETWDTTDGALEETPWTFSLGNRLKVTWASIENNHQPYMKKAEYKEIDNSIIDPLNPGLCKLEMRIYKKDLSATNLKPVMAIHGGSFSYRGLNFMGLEAEISELTEKGFVVFAPFYRLTGSNDGNSACNNVTGAEVLADINDALTWVNNNKARFGASGKVSVFGQSAGAHLSASLASNRPAEIENALLFYPPTDFIDLYNTLGPCAENVAILKRYIGDLSPGDCTTATTADQALIDGSFPPQVETNPTIYPPMYMVHGNEDALVPSSQSTRLCNALSGDAASVTGPAFDDGGSPIAGVFNKTYRCDNKGSRTVLFAEANHMLDACPIGMFEQIIRSAGDLTEAQVRNQARVDAAKFCFSGSISSIQAIQTTMDNAFNWLAPYCSASGSSTSYEWIQSVDINGTVFNTGNNTGYHQSDEPIAMQRGANYVTLTPGFGFGSYTEYWSIWIDYNQNRVFDSNERVYSGSSNSVLAPTITVPASALSGQTGMRIAMFYGSPNPPSCGTQRWGEVEDYIVTID